MTVAPVQMPDRVDVLVVGGGMAGLAPAFITGRRAAASVLSTLADRAGGAAGSGAAAGEGQ